MESGEEMEQPVALEVKGIHKRFGHLEVLRGVSLTAHEGDVISIIGSSGSGKSTLLRCINFLEVPDAGEVFLKGELIRTKKRRDGTAAAADRKQIDRLRATLGMVFQSFNLWSHMTVLENVVEAPIHVQKRPKKEVIAEAEELLSKVGISEKRDHYPSHLSGGQQQRAAIARALACHPQVMLFDEPTSALDPELIGEVLQVIHKLAKEGRTMIIVTHEIAFAHNVSSHVVFLNSGTIEEEGPPEKVLVNPDSERCRAFLAREFG
jgi:octopine/nopaline transport system ATP-binding protein